MLDSSATTASFGEHAGFDNASANDGLAVIDAHPVIFVIQNVLVA